ncbi:MAG: hypothetical protein ACK4RF_06520 [Cyclobacteriaceae bacterium]
MKSHSGHLSQQYQNLLTNAEVIEGYRMVKVFEVDRLWKAVTDSLKEVRTSVSVIKGTNASFQNTIKTLEDKLAQNEKVNEDLLFAGKHISVLGFEFRKPFFITMAFSTVGVLLVVVGGLLYFVKVSYSTSSESRKLYEELCREFDQYRHNAIEKQIKLSREIQDYRNRQMELRSA